MRALRANSCRQLVTTLLTTLGTTLGTTHTLMTLGTHTQLRTAEERLLDNPELSVRERDVSFEGVGMTTTKYSSFRDEDEEIDPYESPPRGARAGSLLRNFLKSPANSLKKKDREYEKSSEETKRDSMDMFSPNNFNAELRDSITFESSGDFTNVDGSIDEIIIGGDTAVNNNEGFEFDSPLSEHPLQRRNS